MAKPKYLIHEIRHHRALSGELKHRFLKGWARGYLRQSEAQEGAPRAPSFLEKKLEQVIERKVDQHLKGVM